MIPSEPLVPAPEPLNDSNDSHLLDSFDGGVQPLDDRLSVARGQIR